MLQYLESMESPPVASKLGQEEIIYLDWNNAFDILEKAYRSGLFVLIIGPKGTGKTSSCKKICFRNEKGT